MSEMDPKAEGKAMDEFEKQLTRALRPVNAPETLAKFLAIAAEAEKRRQKSGKRWLGWKPASGGRLLVLPPTWALPMAGSALAAVLVLGVVVGEHVHRQHERARATAEFETATRITDQAMQQTREQLALAGVPLE
jgi:hypothetical protein